MRSELNSILNLHGLLQRKVLKRYLPCLKLLLKPRSHMRKDT
jgi:hypothetical protein